MSKARNVRARAWDRYLRREHPGVTLWSVYVTAGRNEPGGVLAGPRAVPLAAIREGRRRYGRCVVAIRRATPRVGVWFVTDGRTNVQTFPDEDTAAITALMAEVTGQTTVAGWTVEGDPPGPCRPVEDWVMLADMRARRIRP